MVRGEISRESILNLIVLRQLYGGSAEETQKLRAYLLGLSLVALTLPQNYNLRSGCQLVRDGKDAIKSKLVNRDGEETSFAFDHSQALDFAQLAARTFGVTNEIVEVDFDVEKAKKFLKRKE